MKLSVRIEREWETPDSFSYGSDGTAFPAQGYRNRIYYILHDPIKEEYIKFCTKAIGGDTGKVYGLGFVYTPSNILSFDLLTFDITREENDRGSFAVLNPDKVISYFAEKPLVDVGDHFAAKLRINLVNKKLPPDRQDFIKRVIDECSKQYPEFIGLRNTPPVENSDCSRKTEDFDPEMYMASKEYNGKLW